MKNKLKDCIPDCPDEFKDLDVLFYAYWCSYEEDGWIVVFNFFDELMVCEGGHSVMAENNNFIFDPIPYVGNYESFIEVVRNSNEPWFPWNLEIDLLSKNT